MTARRPTVPLPKFPDGLMKPYAVTKSGADQTELLKLLLEHYSDCKVSEDAPTIPDQQIVQLAWGLICDFVPAFRRSKHRGRTPRPLEWIGDDPSDLHEAGQLSRLIAKHRPDYASTEATFDGLATVHRGQLPPMFRKCWKGGSLKAAYFKACANHPPFRELLRDERAGRSLEKLVNEFREAFRGFLATQGS